VSKKATAAVVHEPEGPFTLQEVELGDLRPGEVYVKIQASGLCHTDLNMQHFLTMPAVVGHEGTGIVEEVGTGVLDVSPGDRVIISWPACGKRYICDAQFPLLFSGRRLDGSTTCKLGDDPISACYFQQSSFSTYAVAPAESLVKVTDNDIPPEILAALPCGAMTGAGSVLNEMKLGPQDSFVSFGVGGVGQAAVMAAHLAGAYPIIAVARNPKRLELALELGATHAVNARTDDVAAKINEIAPHGISHALDSSGAVSSWVAAASVLRTGGFYGVVAAPEVETLGGSTHGMLSKGIRIQFIMAGSALPKVFLPKMIEWYKQGRFPIDKLITTFDFAEINEAVAAANEGRAIKPVLLMR
jgi:aryl-alcohol dehydrogenase